jgi:hypothetical protein
MMRSLILKFLGEKNLRDGLGMRSPNKILGAGEKDSRRFQKLN